VSHRYEAGNGIAPSTAREPASIATIVMPVCLRSNPTPYSVVPSPAIANDANPVGAGEALRSAVLAIVPVFASSTKSRADSGGLVVVLT